MQDKKSPEHMDVRRAFLFSFFSYYEFYPCFPVILQIFSGNAGIGDNMGDIIQTAKVGKGSFIEFPLVGQQV